MRRLIHARDIDYLALGATVLGTGGGGDPYIGALMAKQAIEQYGPVELISIDELADDDLVIPSAMMGAPTVMVEKMPSGDEPVKAFTQLEKFLGRKAAATVSIEAGGLNSTIPFVVAAELGIPLVDADGMGRAFPEIPMTALHFGGIPATPMMVADEKGNTVLLSTVDGAWTEALSRNATIVMGGSSMLALYGANARDMRPNLIHGTLSTAIKIGELLAAKEDAAIRLDKLLKFTDGVELFRGKLTDVMRRTVGGFARGTVTLEGTAGDAGSICRIEFQNENLIAMRDGEPMATVPDLITVLDQETVHPITTEELRYGQRVIVIAMPCAPVWHRPECLELVGPRYFGYDFDFKPLRQVAEHAD
ncbi:DUF917 domain-containing protein [Alicyclobacillus fastidiosus]|uniref:DUF917 domain-containing protein n=2 Tax=Alicyclobacillus fastidiosus TaxID=392011 RepID=A0ABY6ZGW7_9BACL|nr:DUF917 domain-containing protein [Alicyclobacillus fastidiosus]WAH42087.1 DUF917 domain-containing protein [Alicyclobacillus fastidiosus]